jgi:parallel beta-helix repeat protein
MLMISAAHRGRSVLVVPVAILLLVSIAALLPTTVAGQPPNYISGSACAGGPNPRWQSGDTWIMYGDVTVTSGCTLTIEPGATVKGDPNVHLFVDGVLLANGISGTPVSFLDNQTSVIPWAGVQFNSGSSGSVTWASFQRVLVAVSAQSSSPAINNNTMVQVGAGVRLDTSNSLVADNVIDGARFGAYGILLASSSGTVLRNTINGTNIGIQATTSGSPVVTGNTITNLSGNPTLGIYATNLASVLVSGNAIRGIQGSNGGPGGAGVGAIGILVNGTTSVTILRNNVSRVFGGRGGNASAIVTGTGTRGGDGGGALGIAVGFASTALIQGNLLDTLVAGHGGDGGPSGLGKGGLGGTGGECIGIEIFSATTSASFLSNSIAGLTSGSGGGGGSGSTSFPAGAGGFGGSTYGLFSLAGLNPDLSSNVIQALRGGHGGNSTVPGSGGIGGLGGEASGIIAVAEGAATVHANTIASLSGGVGGNGATDGGAGGNASAIIVLGFGPAFNQTTASYNSVSSVTGGPGGIGGTLSGDGGPASGLSAVHVDLSSASNTFTDLLGGAGGAAFVLVNQASRGGDAAGMSLLLSPASSTSLDAINTVTRGSSGSGKAPPASYGVGLYLAGNATVTTRATITNGTLSTVGDFDLYVDNYTAATTVNTPFRWGKTSVQAAGNLTVRNYLAVSVFWPNNVTFVQGPSVVVTDNAAVVYSLRAPAGQIQWLLVTDREYLGSPVPVENTTAVQVTYGTFGFFNDPRSVNMSASHTETFGMQDALPPTSNASALPRFESSRTFSVRATASDGNGTGVKNITLWFRFNGGTWNVSQTLPVSGPILFSFTGSSDGTYEFATSSWDNARNSQPRRSSGNDTWTIVDTVRPASRVATLPAYETSLSFSVSWSPEPGTTDIASYSVQYDNGSGWVVWKPDTALTSAPFTASGQGTYQFRTVATDFAGNTESKSGNDTWTVVDTLPPASAVGALSPYETTAMFGLTWGPVGGTADITNYTVEVSVDGGVWTPVYPGATNRSADFTGADGHRYAFRTIAADRAGNLETKSGNDTWTVVDTTKPLVVTVTPQGPSTNTTDLVVITFSESMNATATVSSFTMSPAVNGTFAWSNGGRVLTFNPSRPLQPGTTYTIVIDTNGKDLAGNALPAVRTFSFSTAPLPAPGFNLIDWWPLFLLIAIAAGAAILLLIRRRSASLQAVSKAVPATASSTTEIDDVFLLYKDGILIKHETLRLRPEIDTDILSGMLTAVQQFVKDSFQSEDEGELNEITVGQMHLHIGRGKWLILAARVAGGDVATMNDQIRKAIQDMEDHHWDQLEDWDGDMGLSRVLGPYLKKLIRGEYA